MRIRRFVVGLIAAAAFVVPVISMSQPVVASLAHRVQSSARSVLTME